MCRCADFSLAKRHVFIPIYCQNVNDFLSYFLKNISKCIIISKKSINFAFLKFSIIYKKFLHKNICKLLLINKLNKKK